MSSSFVFLEVLDPPAIELLTNLRSIFKGRESKSPIHITVRGPYKNTPSKAKLDELWSLIEGEGLLLHGIGKFEFSDRHVVYMRSRSTAIRKIWWKRDFPIIRYGFNPHITLFEGSAKDASEVEDFLKKEGIELYCRQLSLSIYETWGGDLFGQPTRTVVHQTPPNARTVLIDPYRWKKGIEARAADLMKSIADETDH